MQSILTPKPGMAQEWITSLDPQIICMGVSEGSVIPLVTLSRLEELMLLLRGTKPCFALRASPESPSIEYSARASASTRGDPTPRAAVVMAVMGFARPPRRVKTTAARPLAAAGVRLVLTKVAGFVDQAGNDAHRGAQTLSVASNMVEMRPAAAVAEPLVERSRGRTPVKPNVFFSPNSFRAKTDDRSCRDERAALASGPTSVGSDVGLPLTAAASGDHDTRYRELWSLRRVVLASRLQAVLIKAGSRSPVGTGVATGQTPDHPPIWVSRLGALALNGTVVDLTNARAGRANGVDSLLREGALRGSFRPPNIAGVEEPPVWGRRRTAPLVNLYDGYDVKLAEEDQPVPNRETGPAGRRGAEEPSPSSFDDTKIGSRRRERPVRTRRDSSRPIPGILGVMVRRPSDNSMYIPQGRDMSFSRAIVSARAWLFSSSCERGVGRVSWCWGRLGNEGRPLRRSRKAVAAPLSRGFVTTAARAAAWKSGAGVITWVGAATRKRFVRLLTGL